MKNLVLSLDKHDASIFERNGQPEAKSRFQFSWISACLVSGLWRRRAGSNCRIKVLQTELNMSNSNEFPYYMAKMRHFFIAQDFVFMRIFCYQGDKRVTRKML